MIEDTTPSPASSAELDSSTGGDDQRTPATILLGMIGLVAVAGAIRSYAVPTNPQTPGLFRSESEWQAFLLRAESPKRRRRLVFVNADESLRAVVVPSLHSVFPQEVGLVSLDIQFQTVMLYEMHNYDTFSTLQSHMEEATRYAFKHVSKGLARQGEDVSELCVVLCRSVSTVGKSSSSGEVRVTVDSLLSDVLVPGRPLTTLDKVSMREQYAVAYSIDGLTVGFVSQDVEGTVHVPEGHIDTPLSAAALPCLREWCTLHSLTLQDHPTINLTALSSSVRGSCGMRSQWTAFSIYPVMIRFAASLVYGSIALEEEAKRETVWWRRLVHVRLPWHSVSKPMEIGKYTLRLTLPQEGVSQWERVKTDGVLDMVDRDSLCISHDAIHQSSEVLISTPYASAFQALDASLALATSLSALHVQFLSVAVEQSPTAATESPNKGNTSRTTSERKQSVAVLMPLF